MRLKGDKIREHERELPVVWDNFTVDLDDVDHGRTVRHTQADVRLRLPDGPLKLLKNHLIHQK